MMLSVILLSMLMILLFTVILIRHLICDNNQNWLRKLNLIYATLWFGAKSGLFITIAIDVKMDRYVLEEKSSVRMLELTFSSKLDQGSSIVCIAKTPPKKIGAFIHSMKFLLLEAALYLCKSTIWPCTEHAWNTFMSGLMLLAATWKFQINQKKRYVGLLLLPLLHLLNP